MFLINLLMVELIYFTFIIIKMLTGNVLNEKIFNLTEGNFKRKLFNEAIYFLFLAVLYHGSIYVFRNTPEINKMNYF